MPPNADYQQYKNVATVEKLKFKHPEEPEESDKTVSVIIDQYRIRCDDRLPKIMNNGPRRGNFSWINKEKALGRSPEEAEKEWKNEFNNTRKQIINQLQLGGAPASPAQPEQPASPRVKKN